ncbi:hypothetical protein GYMLUDRAFT_36629 [Collybiopsis luxurians FD-317 M1]|nr:hypothetical protein GYMLUDRAFT_36629 [Collybiopsis luxurians FD-317 M1]
MSLTVLAIILSIATAGFAVTPVKRQLASVQADLANIASQVTALDNDLKAFPTSGGSLVSALVGLSLNPVTCHDILIPSFQAIHAQATSLASALGTAATHAAVRVLPPYPNSSFDLDRQNTGPVTDAQAQGILATVEGFEPTILDALTQIVAKKPGFYSLPLGGVSALVAQDLATLKTDTKSFENELVADTPVCLPSWFGGILHSMASHQYVGRSACYGDPDHFSH